VSEVTRADVCAAAIADAFKDDGEIFASPMGTLPMLGVRLAKPGRYALNAEGAAPTPADTGRAAQLGQRGVLLLASGVLLLAGALLFFVP